MTRSIVPDTINIGVATALEGKGLVVPVVRNVQGLDLFEIARELGAVVDRAREDKLTPSDVRDGTFTISNHGVSGSLVATPIIINQPQSAILGVGKLEKRAVVVTRERRRSHRDPAAVFHHADARSPRDGRPPGQSLPAGADRAPGELAGLGTCTWPRAEPAEALEYLRRRRRQRAGLRLHRRRQILLRGGKDFRVQIAAKLSAHRCPPNLAAAMPRAAADRASESCGTRAAAACAG